MDLRLGAGRTTGAVDAQQILARVDRRQGSDVDDMGSASLGATFRSKGEQPDFSLDLRRKRGRARGALGLLQGWEIF